MKVIKRDGRKVDYDNSKIELAIEKAMKYGSGIYKPEVIVKTVRDIEKIIKTTKILEVYQIEEMVFHKLIEFGEPETAKSYESYRAVQEFKRKENTTDDSVIGLLEHTNTNVMSENSNKDPILVSTQRDLIAGEISKDLVKRFLYPPHIIQSHEKGLLHLHDRDYLAQTLHNCEVINLEDMLKNGTKMNGKTIRQPNSFRVASTVTTQIIQAVTSSSYGGASINGIDRILAPYARKSYDKYYKKYLERLQNNMVADNYQYQIEMLAEKYADEDMREEIRDGVQTIQYQINTMNTTQGQSPFVTFLLYFLPDDEYAYEASLIQEEILKQRYEGMENEIGIPTPTSFPKLIYVLDEHNVHEDSEYYYLTKLASKTTAKTLMPDYISAKKMREVYEGNVFVPIKLVA